jgi:GMP synthase (glutamine-hydrolysing)
VHVLVVQHQEDAGLGVFAGVLHDASARVTVWYAPSEPLPAEPPDVGIVLGGAVNCHEEEAHPWLREEKSLLGQLLEAGVPILGVCLGAQLLADAAGGEVRRASRPEIGWSDVLLEPAGETDPVTRDLPPRFEAFSWHSYEALPPAGSLALAASDVCTQAFRLPGRLAWGIQFHAEVDAATAERWIEDYESDADAVRVGVDPERMLAEMRPRLPGWNALGTALCRRFLGAVTRA